jgi:site-specific recombinase XerD
MRLPENIVRRGGVYQFRIDVPIDCQGRPPFGQAKEWKKSLKTNDLREATERAARLRIQFQKMCREARAEKDPRVIAPKRIGGWLVDALADEFISPNASREEIAAKAEATLADFREKLAQDDWRVLLYREAYSEEHEDVVDLEELRVPLAYVDAMVAALRRALDVERAELAPLRLNDAEASTDAISDDNPTLGEVLEKAAREKSSSPSTLANYKSSIARLEAMHGSKRLKEWTVGDLRQFKEQGIENGKALGTLAKDLSAFRLVFGYAQKNGLRGDNPATQVSRPGKVAKLQRNEFNDAQLKLLLSNVAEGTDEWWLLRVALFCGMREGEIAQLRHTDVRKQGDVWVIDINANQDGYGPKSLKRGSTARLIPVPQQILDEGFLKFARRHDGRIFAAFKDTDKKRAAQRVSRWFTAYRRSLGIEPSAGKMLDFHSFRHTFKSRARQEMAEEWSDAITGHSNGRLIGRSYGKYELQTMKEQIDKIGWPA